MSLFEILEDTCFVKFSANISQEMFAGKYFEKSSVQ